MKDLDFKDKSSPRLFGKGMVIVIVVVFSSLSFVLGYFVGKVGRQEPVEPLVGAVDTSVQSNASNPKPPKPDSNEQSRSASSDYKAHEAAAGNPLEDAPEPVGSSSAPTAEHQKSASKQSAAAIVADGHASVETNGEVYTVQLGALRNAEEAKKLRAKFKKKGYRTFLMVTKNRKHEKIYKVWLGEFREKEEAEILALKLRKTEGLKAFVTVKN